MKMKETNKTSQVEKEAQSSSGSSPQAGGPKQSSSPPRTPGTAHTKTDARVAYGVLFGRSTYEWKTKEINFPIDPATCLNSDGVNRNSRNNMTSRICQGAAPLSFGLLSHVSCRAKWPKWWTPPWPPPATQGRPLRYKLSSRYQESWGFV